MKLIACAKDDLLRDYCKVRSRDGSHSERVHVQSGAEDACVAGRG